MHNLVKTTVVVLQIHCLIHIPLTVVQYYDGLQCQKYQYPTRPKFDHNFVGVILGIIRPRKPRGQSK